MFKALGLKIYAILGLIITVLLALVGYQRKTIKKQEHEIKVKDFVKEVADKQIEDEKEVLDNEQNEIKKETNVRANLSKSDRFNRL